VPMSLQDQFTFVIRINPIVMHIEWNQKAEAATRVMVMSADLHLGSILNILLQDRGFVTSAMHQVAQGLEAIENDKTDILILDETLPGALGTDVLQKVMIQYPEVPVIFLTNDPHSNAAVEAILLGAYGVIAKPVEVSQLGLILVGAKARKAQHRPIPVSDLSAAPGCAA
jgi:two-component system, NtrC family, response regulator AtoC